MVFFVEINRNPNKERSFDYVQTNSHRQGGFEFVNIEELVPRDHLLRKIDVTIDFSFIAEKTRSLYCENNGRPCVDPVMLFKMLFIGYLFGIRSERRLIEEIRVNVAYRWFVGLSLTDPVPHSTTFSQNRRRSFNGTTIFQEKFLMRLFCKPSVTD